MKGRDRCLIFLLCMLLDVGTFVYGFLLSGVNGHSGTDGTSGTGGTISSCAYYHLDNFIDRSCFMIHTPQGEMVYACPANTLFSTSHCGCTQQMDHNHHYLPACSKAHHHGGYMTNVSPQPTGHNTGNTQSGANTTTQLQHYHSHCEHIQSYQHYEINHIGYMADATCNAGDAHQFRNTLISPPNTKFMSFADLMALKSVNRYCATLDEVIEDLYHSSKDMVCTIQAIKRLRNYTDHMSGDCSCETIHHYLTLQYDQATHACRNSHRNYQHLIDAFYGNTNYRRTCLQQKDAWKLLDDMNDENCVRSFIHYLRGTFHSLSSRYICHCSRTHHHIQTTSITTESTTNIPTTATFKGISCNKLQTILVLANHSAVTFSHSGQCPDGTHAKPEAIAMSLCGTHDLTAWHPGLNVLQHCDSLPTYIAVASFFNGVYPKDGIAGVMVHCNDTAITILTQECGHGAQLVHFDKDVYARAVEMPQSYFTISQLEVNKPIFG